MSANQFFKALVISTLSGLVFYSATGQPFLNLDFEYADQNKPRKWYLSGETYDLNVVTDVSSCGEQAMRFYSGEATDQDFGVCTGSFPFLLASGKEMTLRGKIKTKDVTTHVGLWLRIDGPEGPLQFDNMMSRPISGTQDWTEYEIILPVDTIVKNINFGALMVGSGTAWVDCLEIFLDGEKYLEKPPRLQTATPEEIEWLKNNIIPISSVDPNHPETKDLAAIKQLIGGAKIVALGEVTHGAREIFQMKHRIIKYLRENDRFDLFSIEANMPESYDVDGYVKGEEGEPKALLKGMYFWTWQTEEVLSMVEWMRMWNQQNEEQISFTGFDMQYVDNSVWALQKILDQSIDWDEFRAELRVIRAIRSSTSSSQITEDQRNYFNEALPELRKAINEKNLRQNENEWALQHVRLIEQYLDISYLKRDRYMAENVKWIAQQNPNSKLILWAHNAHIQETDGRMGSFLAQSYEDDYVTIGFTFFEGEFTATGQNGLGTYRSEKCPDGSYESIFNAVGQEMFLLDLRNVPKSGHGKWIYDDLLFRQTGARKMENELQETALHEDFDMIIFIKNISASRLIR